MMHIAYSPYFHKIYKYPPISAKCINLLPACVQFTLFGLIYVFCFPNYFGHGAFARTGRPSVSLYMFLFLSLFLCFCLSRFNSVYVLCLSKFLCRCLYVCLCLRDVIWGGA